MLKEIEYKIFLAKKGLSKEEEEKYILSSYKEGGMPSILKKLHADIACLIDTKYIEEYIDIYVFYKMKYDIESLYNFYMLGCDKKKLLKIENEVINISNGFYTVKKSGMRNPLKE
ncbi:MAG: hypothetical protein KKC80_08720 [Candidatus Margulisbacteria bacterium]|nr:hypothetical protein [Candidatus Margulisiibacteriota bacterium]